MTILKFLNTYENARVERAKRRKLEPKVVWRGSWEEGEHKLYDGMFFSEDRLYATVFGNNIEKYVIHPKKTLNLFKYNKIWNDHISKNREQFPFSGFDRNLFHMHSNEIRDGWEVYMDRLYNADLKEVADQFMKELKECDSIFGPDAGNDRSRVWYMKSKNDVEKA